MPVSVSQETNSRSHNLPPDSNQLRRPSNVSSVLKKQTFFLLVPRSLDPIEVPVSHRLFLGNISVEARATAISLAGALEGAETHHDGLRSNELRFRIRLSAAFRCHFLRAKLKAFLRLIEHCRRAIVTTATIILLWRLTVPVSRTQKPRLTVNTFPTVIGEILSRRNCGAKHCVVSRCVW